MRTRMLLAMMLLAPVLGIGLSQSESGPSAERLVAAEVPSEDPGPPFYARVSPIMNELFFSDGWLAIPFYRDPACVPPDFNLLDLYHFPSESGPGAFGCPALVTGLTYKEPGAPATTFPKRVTMDGSGSVQIWFVAESTARQALADGNLTMAELEDLDPLVGIAATFSEYLQPRAEDHLIVIWSTGELMDGRSFRFDLLHVGEAIEELTMSIGE